MRARTVPVGAKVDVQKITDPTVESQWETWTTIDSNNAGTLSVSLFWTGAYVVLCYQDATSLNLVYRRSTDGVTWGAETTAYALTPHIAYFSGVSGGSAQSGLFVTYNYQLYWAAYNPGADTWTALGSAALTLTSEVQELAGFYDSANSRHVVAFAPNGLFRWSRFGLVILTRGAGGAWGTPRVYLQSDNLGCRYLSVSQSRLNGFWWLTFGRQTGWGSTEFWLACSDDGVYWEEPLFTDIDVNGHAEVLGSLTGYSGLWLATEELVYKASAHAFWSNRPVVRYAFSAGDITRRVGGGRSPHLTVAIDNRDGLATAPQLNALLTLERGYHSAGSDHYQSAGAYYVVGFRYLLEDQVLEVRAVDTLGLLTTFVSDAAFNFEGETVQALVTLLCALAGVHSVSFDASPLWADTLSAFTHPANENGRVSLESLRERLPFDYTVEQAGTLAFYVPAASPAVDYLYGRGAGEHTHWPGEFGRNDSPNYTKVVGAPPRTVGGERADHTALYAAGRRQTEFILDRRVKLAADARALAAARVVFNQERRGGGYFEAPPNFALEVGDVVEFSGGLYADTAGPWRVEQIQELFNPPSGRRFFQRIWLRGTA